MIDELLDFVRARAGGQLPLNEAPVDLRQVLEQVVAEAELGGAGGRVTIATTGDVTGVWDPDRLVQMVDNLVRNALRYGAPDRPVRIEAEGHPDDVAVAVVNEGPGISPERQQRLFEPFARGQDQDGEGLGLGLFIVRAVATSHGGAVDVTSSGGRPGSSCVFPGIPQAA